MSTLPRAVPVLLLVALLPSTGWTMHMRSVVHPVAVSADGRSLLLSQSDRGPEGGGASSLILLSLEAPQRTTFLLSRDLSPGDGSTPQTVSAAQCASELEKLKAALAAKGFVGVTVASTCASRSGLVTVSPAERARAQATRFTKRGTGLALGGWQLEGGSGALKLSGPGGVTELALTYPIREELAALGTPDMRLLVLLDGSFDHTWMIGIWGTWGAFPESFAPLWPK